MRYTIVRLILVCLTLQEMNDKICWIACRKDGYDTGNFVKNKCICGTERDFEDITGTTLVILQAPRSSPTYYRYSGY